ncbi:MAG: glycosyltransferase [Bacteroidetes bacterium]|nr:MAG: glycosyltransferase [Bacteroidota bacterium]
MEKGDKLRAYYQIRELSKKHRIILCCLSDKKVKQQHIEELEKFCEEVYVIKLSRIKIAWRIIKAFFTSDIPLQVAYFYSKDAQKQIDDLIEKHLPKFIYAQLVRTSEYVKKYAIFHKTLDYMDAFSAGMERRVSKSGGLVRYVLQKEAERLKKYEAHIADYFEEKTVISEQDRNKLQAGKPAIIPNGVDFSKFQPSAQGEKKFDIIFSGNMSYPPNVDAALFLVRRILPLLKQKYPGIQMVLAGASPAWKVKMLSSENVLVTGWVEDIKVYFEQSKIMVAPMFMGAGLQNKLLEAMAMKIPCVTTSLANNALKATPEKEVLLAETEQQFFEQIDKLLQNETYRDTIAENGYRFAKQHYDWEHTVQKLEKLIVVD